MKALISVHKAVDAAPVALFRMGLGGLMAAEGFGAIITGWVRQNYVEVDFTFPFIGFEFLDVLCGPQAYVVYSLLGVFGLMIAAGFRYRLAALGYFILWTMVYLGQKTSYNNHYFLLWILSFLICFVPANKYASLDVKHGRVEKSDSVAYGYVFLFKFLLLIVYVYAAIAKLYPDWLSGEAVRSMLSTKGDMPVVGPWVNADALIFTIAYGGILFDLFIIPALWYKPTRFMAFLISIGFHLFNSIVFQIGIFPYLMLVSTVLYFDAALMRRIFFRNSWTGDDALRINKIPRYRTVGAVFLFGVMIALPLRHHLYPGNVHWTEEGHRLSWHMMLRMKYGTATFKVYDSDGAFLKAHYPDQEIWEKHAQRIGTRPDFVWQYAQRLAKDYQSNGVSNVAVYANVRTSLNGRPLKPLIDPSANLAAEPWSHFRHHEWIYLSPDP